LVELAPAGSLYSFSEVFVSPREFPPVYVVGYVDLDDGIRVFGQIDDDFLNLKIGARMHIAIGTISRDPDGERVISYKFIKEEQC